MSQKEHAPTLTVENSFQDKTVFGFWVYLMTDLVLFATLFATYGVLRHSTAGGPDGHELFSLPYVLIETLALLTSSFTSGLGLLAAHAGRRRQVIIWFSITFLLGGLFLGLELSEFAKLAHEGHSWRQSAFLSAFFTLVGTHGAHITCGLLWMAVLLARTIRFRGTALSAKLVKQLTLLSLFWHMLDVVWIFIFTIVYLIGAA